MQKNKTVLIALMVVVAAFSLGISAQAKPRRPRPIRISSSVELSIDQQNQLIRDTLAKTKIKSLKKLAL